ncbi:Uncharacterized protein dnm_000870 [Desulfonema magnum]|uniref:Uncharacterized protein n=1 Tax=Desulfonema magnum TaxID=45655 RepID=A0A975BE94_9BACT|nr:Uncharacterized protein dnm_000870 [Desulfonema magnum]
MNMWRCMIIVIHQNDQCPFLKGMRYRWHNLLFSKNKISGT